ncbi:hypothetical protein PUV44_10805 [Xanthomonas arboricola pv. corylina]|nr:hypothetical protein PUV44_10805 [Xanthomonas arboricola pv. corylina]
MRAGSPLAMMTPVWSITLTLPSMMVIARSTMDRARVRSSVSMGVGSVGAIAGGHGGMFGAA